MNRRELLKLFGVTPIAPAIWTNLPKSAPKVAGITVADVRRIMAKIDETPQDYWLLFLNKEQARIFKRYYKEVSGYDFRDGMCWYGNPTKLVITKPLRRMK